MRLGKGNGFYWLLALVSFLSSLGIPEEAPTGPATRPATESWQKPYRELHDLVLKLDEQVSRNYFPEFLLIREGAQVAMIQLDAFGAKVLRELDDVLLPYREGLQRCVERHQNEYRSPQTYSYERFGWLLDRYAAALKQALGGADEVVPEKGVRVKAVMTDAALYAHTRLAAAYLQERMERFRNAAGDSYAADRTLEAAVSDVGRRVLRLNFNQKFDRRELIELGPSSQPVFRDLASVKDAAVAQGLEPLAGLVRSPQGEPFCEVTLLNKRTALKE